MLGSGREQVEVTIRGLRRTNGFLATTLPVAGNPGFASWAQAWRLAGPTPGWAWIWVGVGLGWGRARPEPTLERLSAVTDRAGLWLP